MSNEARDTHETRDNGDGVARPGGSDGTVPTGLGLDRGTACTTQKSKFTGPQSGDFDLLEERNAPEKPPANPIATLEPRLARGQSQSMLSSDDAKADGADAQEQVLSAAAQARNKEAWEVGEVLESAPNSTEPMVHPLGREPPHVGPGAKVLGATPLSSAHISGHTMPGAARLRDLIVSEGFLMAPTPRHILVAIKYRGAHTKEFEDEKAELLGRTDSGDGLPRASDHQEHSTTSPTPSPTPPSPTHEAMPGENGSRPVAGPPLCEGDTTLTQNFLPPGLIANLFERLGEEVHFKKMMHLGGEVPRFVAVQGAIAADGTQPVYRHPSDESPPLAAFTPTVQLIRVHVERALGHPVNHVLIQCYRNGSDYISEHSDKTLDVDRWSHIANVSIGAMRTMVFRSKRPERKDRTATATATAVAVAGLDKDDGAISLSGSSSPPPDRNDRAETAPADVLQDPAPPPPPKRYTTRCPMPHNSLIKMGLLTNEKWLHGIKPDKRRDAEKSADELAWHGMRISLTFRNIGTFLSPSASPSEPLIWGQGAVAKTREHARPVVNGQTPEAIALLKAFGRENNSPVFDWEAHYGRGYDVLHMKAAPRYFGCSADRVADGRVRIMLAECGVKYARGDIGVGASAANAKGQGQSNAVVEGAAAAAVAEVGEVRPVRFVVDDADRTTAVGDVAILLFLDAKYPRKRGSDSEVAAAYSRFYAAYALEQRWRSLRAQSAPWESATKVFGRLKPHLTELEKWAAEVARHKEEEVEKEEEEEEEEEEADASIADFALWPVLHDMAVAWKAVARGRGAGQTVFEYWRLWALDAYYRGFAERRSVLAVFGEDVVASVLPEPCASDEEGDESGAEDGEDGEGVEDLEKAPGKGKLPKLTEFGGDGP